jgi:hypothetical protein
MGRWGIRLGTRGLATVMAGLLWAAAAAAEPAESIERTEVLLPDSASEPRQFRLNVEQVFFPGVPDRVACRMQIRAFNDSKQRIGLRLLIQTYNKEKELLDSWLVPTTELAPGQEMLRLYSCRPAVLVEVMRNSDYGWPNSCQIAGEDTIPCPVVLNYHSALALAPVKDPNVKEEKKKPEKKPDSGDKKKKDDKKGGEGGHH